MDHVVSGVKAFADFVIIYMIEFYSQYLNVWGYIFFLLQLTFLTKMSSKGRKLVECKFEAY